ncbi:MalM family protein [Spongorhabdus nitratireducens]
MPEEQAAPKAVTPGKVYRSLAELKCMPLPDGAVQGRTRIILNESTQQLELPSGKTPFVAYDVPQTGYHKITVKSYVIKDSRGKDELFFPEVALLDQHQQLISKIDPNVLKHQKPGFVTSEGVQATFDIDNRALGGRKTACLVVYTTDKLRGEKTTLVNQAKEYANARGIQPLPVPDPIARHGNYGSLNITLKSHEAYGAAALAITPVVAAAIAPALASDRVEAMKPGPVSLPKEDKGFVEMQTYYISQVKQALSDKRLPEALKLRSQLRDIAQATEGYFVSQYGKSGDAVSLPQKPSEAGGYAAKALYQLQLKIAEQLKAGNGAGALQIVDQAHHFKSEIDQLFNL